MCVKNGGGAIRDFGCYGANLMTWLMQDKAAISVTALTHSASPASSTTSTTKS